MYINYKFIVKQSTHQNVNLTLIHVKKKGLNKIFLIFSVDLLFNKNVFKEVSLYYIFKYYYQTLKILFDINVTKQDFFKIIDLLSGKFFSKCSQVCTSMFYCY